MTKKRIVLLAALLLLSGCGNVGLPADASDSPEVNAEQESSGSEGDPQEGTTESEEASGEKASEAAEPTEEAVLPESTKAVEESKESVVESSEPTEGETSPEKESGSDDVKEPEDKTQPTPEVSSDPAADSEPNAEGASQPSEQTPPPSTASQPQNTHTCSWDGGKTTQAATCSSEGVMTYTCTSCGTTRTETIAKTDHSYAWMWHLDEDLGLGNCMTRHRIVDMCATCGYILNTHSDYTEESHELNEPVMEGGPICIAAIVYTQTCKKCGQVFTQTYESTGRHEPARWDSSICGTCSCCLEHKYSGGKCKNCGVVHNCSWDGGEELTPATCTQEGEMRYRCSCGNEKRDKISKKPHDFQVFTHINSNFEEVSEERCSICGAYKN